MDIMEFSEAESNTQDLIAEISSIKKQVSRKRMRNTRKPQNNNTCWNGFSCFFFVSFRLVNHLRIRILSYLLICFVLLWINHISIVRNTPTRSRTLHLFTGILITLSNLPS